MKKMKLKAIALTGALTAGLCGSTFAGEVTIHSDENVRVNADWVYSLQSAETGETYAVTKAEYRGSDVTLYSDDYDGSGNTLIIREEKESDPNAFPAAMMDGSDTDTDASSGEKAEDGFGLSSGESTGEETGGTEMAFDFDMPGDFDPWALNGGDPDPEIVDQFEKVRLDDFTYTDEEGNVQTTEYDCYVYAPENAETKSLPIVFALHGLGECGTNGSNLTANRMATCWIDPSWQAQHPCIVVAPQAPVHLLDTETIQPYPEILNAYVDALKAVFDQMIEKYSPGKVYLTGVSMGSITSFWFLSKYPDYPFDACLLNCGAALGADVTTITDTNILLLSDYADGTVKTSDVCDTYNTIVAAGDQNITLDYSYMNYGHFIWTYSYDNPEYMNWLFEQ